MQADTLTRYTDMVPDEIERLLALPAEAIYADASYMEMVKRIDTRILDQTSPYVREVYTKGLPEIKEKYDLADTIMSAYTLCNWALGYLMHPGELKNLLYQHAAVPTESIVEALPEILDLLNEVPEGREEWQHALVLLTLPLLKNE